MTTKPRFARFLIRCGTPLLLALGLCSCSPAEEATAQAPQGGGAAARGTEPGEPDRAGEDWPWFLGPTHEGISRETDLLEEWPPEGPPLLWERSVGTGYSAPSVLGSRLVLHHREGDEEIVECLRADTGETLWKYPYGSRFRDPYGYNNGPRCSPVLTPTHCYTLGAEGKLLCVRLDSGQPAWERDLLQEFTVPDGFFGVGATPILEGDKLIVLVGGQPNSGVVAFNAATGSTEWENVGRSTWDGAETGWSSDPICNWTGEEMVASYSSPVAATIHGKRHVLCLMRHGLVSLDPETGEERFRYWFRSRVHESVNAAGPVVVEDRILLTAAYRVGSALLQVKPSGSEFDVLWSDPRNLLAHWSTPIYHDGCFFGFTGRHENEGALRCLDAATGEVRWEASGWERMEDLARGPDGSIVDRRTGESIPWPLYGRGSKILADGRFIVLAERGTLALVEAQTAGWKEISRCAAPRMKYPSWTAPVLSRGRLFLRDEDALVCLDLRR